MTITRNVTWFTNLEHGQRHAPMQLMTQADNLRYNKQLVKKGGYRHYDNIDAMDVPLSIAIPSDYDGVMGVPVSYLDHHCPEQFDIVGLTQFSWLKIADKVYPKQTQVNKNGTEQQVTKLNDGAAIEVTAPPEKKTYYKVGDKMYVKTFPRVLIQRKVEA